METPSPVAPGTRDQSTQYVARQRKERRAGLAFPVTRIRRYMQERNITSRITSKAAVSLASTLEYLCSEIIELAGDECLDESKSKIIKPRHISLAINKDDELHSVTGDSTVFPMSTVIPYLDPLLSSKKTKPRKT